MAVSAVEQLQVMASKRQYKEAAAQLEVCYFWVYSLFAISTEAKGHFIIKILNTILFMIIMYIYIDLI